MTIADQIYTLVKTLPHDEANEILMFAEFVRSKRENGVRATDPEEPKVPWSELVRSLAGGLGLMIFLIYRLFVLGWGKTFFGRAFECTSWIPIP